MAACPGTQGPWHRRLQSEPPHGPPWTPCRVRHIGLWSVVAACPGCRQGLHEAHGIGGCKARPGTGRRGSGGMWKRVRTAEEASTGQWAQLGDIGPQQRGPQARVLPRPPCPLELRRRRAAEVFSGWRQSLPPHVAALHHHGRGCDGSSPLHARRSSNDGPVGARQGSRHGRRDAGTSPKQRLSGQNAGMGTCGRHSWFEASTHSLP